LNPLTSILFLPPATRGHISCNPLRPRCTGNQPAPPEPCVHPDHDPDSLISIPWTPSELPTCHLLNSQTPNTFQTRERTLHSAKKETALDRAQHSSNGFPPTNLPRSPTHLPPSRRYTSTSTIQRPACHATATPRRLPRMDPLLPRRGIDDRSHVHDVDGADSNCRPLANK
jgi:hypothetical protein